MSLFLTFFAVGIGRGIRSSHPSLFFFVLGSFDSGIFLVRPSALLPNFLCYSRLAVGLGNRKKVSGSRGAELVVGCIFPAVSIHPRPRINVT